MISFLFSFHSIRDYCARPHRSTFHGFLRYIHTRHLVRVAVALVQNSDNVTSNANTCPSASGEQERRG